MEMLDDQMALKMGFSATDLKAGSPRKSDSVASELVEDEKTSSSLSSSSSSSSSFSSSMWSSEGKQAEVVNGGKQVVDVVSAVSQVLVPAAAAVNQHLVLDGDIAAEEVLAGSGGEPINGNGGINSSNVEDSAADKKPQETGLHFLLTEKTSGNENVSSSSVSKHRQFGVVKEIKQEVAEWDVERVIEEQVTHDLICPNCNSCITKKVILRKRKRHPQIDNPVIKKTQPFGGNADPSVPVPGIMPSGLDIDDSPHDTEPVAFRCGACFSFFIQTVTGCRIFKIFRPKSELPSGPQIPAGTTNQGTSVVPPRDSGEGKVHVSSVPRGSPLNVGEAVGGPIERKNAGETQDGEKKNEGTSGASSPNNEDKVHVSFMPGGSLPSVGKTVDGAIERTSTGSHLILHVKQDQDGSAGPSHSIPADTESAPEVSPVRQTVPIRSSEWDILKSIVYGGLVEIITSLGVVSSAAGGDAETMNIIALAMANLVTGLLITVNGIRELKIEPVKEQQVDRYEEVLGRRKNYWRHSVAVVLSYIVFGLLPPLIYGFSFRKSDNKEYKLVAVAAVSIVCVALLAAGKAHVRKSSPRSYISTILLYVSTAVTASGLSFVVGELTMQLLEKLGLFEPSSISPTPPAFPKAMSGTLAWASY